MGRRTDGGGEATAETPWFRDEVETGLDGKKFLLNFAQEIETEELGEIEAKTVKIECPDEVLEAIDDKSAGGGRFGAKVVTTTAVVGEAAELVGGEVETLVDAGEVIGETDVIVDDVEDYGQAGIVECVHEIAELGYAGSLIGA